MTLGLSLRRRNPVSEKRTTSRWLAFGIVALALVALLMPGVASAQSKQVTLQVTLPAPIVKEKCLECHDGQVNLLKFTNSVHGNNSCTSCHADIIDVDKHAMGEFKPGKVQCGTCHAVQFTEYKDSVHRVKNDFDCTACHTPIHDVPKWDGKKKSIIEKCTECHGKEDYVVSGHAEAALHGNEDAPVCSDCHGLHNTKALHANMEIFPEEARLFYTQTCKRCHGDREMMKRNGLRTDVVDTYEHTYHGKIQKLGYATHVAGCADCHTTHSIKPKTDPGSPIHPDNLVKNCGKCHEHANANFVKFRPHADFLDRHAYPELFWTVVLMSALLLGTFVFFWFHTLLWWRKTYWEKQRRLSNGEILEAAHIEGDNPGEWYVRFKPIARAMHIILNLCFFTLTITGLPLKFNDEEWSRAVIGFLGGANVAGNIHRTAAAILITLFTGAIVMSVRFLLNPKHGKNVWERLTSPDSLWPRKQDWYDFRDMFKWFLDMGPMPKFDRWTYWEKFDFLAVFWGMFAIGTSGLILWMPEVTARVLPGWIFNVAIIVHSDEALLATGFIFTVHFFNTHFIPTKFPMDTVIFTGRIQKYKFLEEKPLYYERLAKSGRLEKNKGGAPDILTNLFSSGIGILFLTTGIVLTVLIVISLLT